MNLNFGIGTRSYANKNHPHQSSDLGFFASFAVAIKPHFSLIIDHMGVATSIGLSMAPLPNFPIVVNVAAWDILLKVKDHGQISFMGAVAYVYMF